MLLGYRLLALALTPVLLLLLAMRLVQGKEDPRRVLERLGWSRRRRPAGPLVWLHAASVGELNSLVPLLQVLCRSASDAEAHTDPAPAVLITTVTCTAARLAAQRLPRGVIHQYVPLDHPCFFALFRHRWRPDLGVLAEAELWPELIHAMPRPLLINARMSERSFRGHSRWPWYSRWLLARFRLVLAQSQRDGERFSRLGARAVRAVGSTKRDAAPLPVDGAMVASLQATFAGRPVLLLASSHGGEEKLLVTAYPALRRQIRNLALLLVPRHPQRAEEVAALAARHGLQVRCWSRLISASEGPAPPAGLDAVVVDHIGDMGAWIAAAQLVVMGGSLGAGRSPIGGHNPLEPLRLGRPVLCGPDMANFAELCDELAACGWLQQHATVERLWQAVADHPVWQGGNPGCPPALPGPSGWIAQHIRAELATPAPGLAEL